MKFFLRCLLLLLPLTVGLFTMNSCHKELFSSKGGVSFSPDTLTFDTVFSTLGSVTLSFTVRNTQNKAVNISDIKLMQQAGTQFRILVPPNPATNPCIEYKNISIPAHDSIYVFVEVTINPNNANNPFVVLDQIQFVTNGVTQHVVLEAMGQNAHYWFSYQVLRNTSFTFPNDKPNIIVNKNGGLPIFAVDTGATCTIPAGCKIFMGPGAVMTVDGTLNAIAPSWSDSIIFQYIRTDYGGLPGEWLGITYSRIATVNMSHVIIDQSNFGLSDEYVLDLLAQAQITTSNLTTSYSNSQLPSVTLNNVIIRNSSTTALTALCTNLNATNCLFFSCGGALMQIGYGGNYKLTNCTLANTYSQYISSQNQALSIIDDIRYINNALVTPLATTVKINNSIVGGNTSQNNGNDIYFFLNLQSSDHITFNNSFLTTVADSITSYQALNINCIDTLGDPYYAFNPPIFSAPFSNNYMPDSASLVITGGNTSLQPATDLYDLSRANTATIGAIVWHH